MLSFKSEVVKLINRTLSLAGARIVGSQTDRFDMKATLKRIPSHGIRIDNVIDIGGSTGIWSARAIETFPSATFVAIEPLVEREPALRALARKLPNFTFELCSAGATDGDMATLAVAQDLDGSTINGDGNATRQVPVKTIDAIVAKRNLTGPFLLKFDTHGYELPILKGAKETLENTSIIIMEVYNFQISESALRFHEMCNHMESLGFRCYDMADPLLRAHDKALWQMDLFFCKKNEKIFNHPHYK